VGLWSLQAQALQRLGGALTGYGQGKNDDLEDTDVTTNATVVMKLREETTS